MAMTQATFDYYANTALLDIEPEITRYETGEVRAVYLHDTDGFEYSTMSGPYGTIEYMYMLGQRYRRDPLGCIERIS
jgi:hypothetical protein